MATTTKPVPDGGVKAPFKPAVALADPNNVESQLAPVDFAGFGDNKKPTKDHEALAALVMKRKRIAESYRVNRESNFLLAIAWYYDRQWTKWNNGKIEDINQDPNDKFWYQVWNLIQPLCDEHIARLCAKYPDVWMAPDTDSPEDKEAARIADSALSHIDHVNDAEALLYEQVFAAAISTTCFRKIVWDAQAYAEVSVTGADGRTSSESKQIGDVRQHNRLGIDLLVDPNARRDIEEAGWIIDRSIVSLDELRGEFPDCPWILDVQPTCYDSTYGSILNRLESITNDVTQSAASDQFNCVERLEMWEKATTAFPRMPKSKKNPKGKPGGRYMVVGGGMLVHSGDWPYENVFTYPYAEFGYRKALGSIWAENFVTPLMDLQMSYNKARTYMVGRATWDVPTWFVNPAAQIPKDFAVNPHCYAKIPVQQGIDPHFHQPPSPSDFYFKHCADIWSDMRAKAGVSNMALEDMPAQAISGKLYDMALQQDKSRAKPIADRIERMLAKAANISLALYEQFATSQPRVLAIDRRAQPQKQKPPQGGAPQLGAPPPPTPGAGAPAPMPAPMPPSGNAATVIDAQLAKLAYGQYRAMVVPGSGFGRTPEAETEEWMDVFKAGGFGPAGSAPSVESFLEGLQSIRSDINTDNIIARVKKWEAEQAAAAPNPMAIQQAQAQAQAAQQQAAAQAAQQLQETLAAIKVNAEAKIQAARTQADIAIEQQREKSAIALAQAQEQIAERAAMVKLQNDIALANNKANNDAALAKANAANPPSMTIQAKAGPQATASMEEAAGLTPDEPAVLTKMLMPPKPAPAAGGKPTPKKD